MGRVWTWRRCRGHDAPKMAGRGTREWEIGGWTDWAGCGYCGLFATLAQR